MAALHAATRAAALASVVLALAFAASWWLAGQPAPLSPQDCASELPGFSAFSDPPREIGVRARIVADARIRSSRTCSRERGCFYLLQATKDGWFLQIEPHPYRFGNCEFVIHGGLNYLYSSEGSFLKDIGY